MKRTMNLLSLFVALSLFTMCQKDDSESADGIVKDIDGNVYNTVTIGTQVWMVENLKTTSYNDGTLIPNVTDKIDWGELNTGAYCWYNNDLSNKESYGALYNWYAVNSKKLCPKGWHVPTDKEWTTLTNYLGGEDIAGGKLKAIGTVNWSSPNNGATNETGFTAVGGGSFSGSGFDSQNIVGIYWSSTNVGSYSAYFRNMSNEGTFIFRNPNDMTYGFSVKCIKD